MNADQLCCPGCGAALAVVGSPTTVKCEYCGRSCALSYSQGQATVIAAERVGAAITTANAQVSDTIRSSGDATQLELKRLQLAQDIASSQTLLTSLQSEIRSLERQNLNKVGKRQLKELRRQESEIQQQLRALRNATTIPGGQTESSKAGGATPRSARRRSAFLDVVGVYVVSLVAVVLIAGACRSDGLMAAGLVLGTFVIGPFLSFIYYRGYQARRQKGIPPPPWWGTDMPAFAEGFTALRKRMTEQAQ